jgi:hypothetical protein
MNALFCLILTLAALSPAAEITGTIVDENGKVVPGISLSVVSLPASQVIEKALSASDGSFSVTGLASGSYGLEAKTDSACAFSDAIQVHNGFTSIVRLRLVRGLCSGAFAKKRT